MDAKKVGKSIAFLRKHYGMTQGELADMLHVTDKAVSRWERGLGSPDVSLLTKLSIILDTDIESILAGNLTYHELAWCGILNLRYSGQISADKYLFDKRIVYFQLGFLMLAGIRDICIRGAKKDLEFIKDEYGSGEKLGLHLLFEEADAEDLTLEKALETWTGAMSGKSDVMQNDNKGVMIIDGLDFIYGKDVTKIFRRVMYDANSPVQLANFKRNPASIYFFPNTDETKHYIECMYKESNEPREIIPYVMDRGITMFPIKDDDTLLDASTFLRILEKQQGEKVADLNEIALRRGFVEE